MKKVRNWIVTLLILLVLQKAQCTYRVFVTIHSLENRGGRCADEQFCNGGEGCCESATCATTACEYVLEYCNRFPPLPLSHQRSVDFAACAMNNRRYSEPVFKFERNQSNFGTENPISFAKGSLIYDVVQIHFELRHNNTVLVDRFLLEVPSIPGHQFSPFFLNGIFGFARMNVSTSLICTRTSCGQQCERTTNCTTCEAGLTGAYCSDLISFCEESTCNNSNMRCIDQLMDTECVCNPGFTGSDCSVNINECSGEEALCSFHGKCLDTIGYFQCECYEGFTGKFCETTLPKYSIEITFHSFNNPDGKCADLSGTCDNGTGCCEWKDCRDTRCNYMFLYCLRPMGSAISYYRSENRGSCNFNETSSSFIAEGDQFFSSIYGTRNPITYTTNILPLKRMEFYIELIDDDRGKSGEENNELIDRFVIPFETSISKKKYEGIFGLASINLSINISCLEIIEKCDLAKDKMVSTASSTPSMKFSAESMATIPIVAAVLSVLTFLVIILVIFFAILYGLHNRKNNAPKIDSLEMNERNVRNGGQTQNITLSARSHGTFAVQSIRERLESLPNTYNQIKNYVRRTETNPAESSIDIASPLTEETNFSCNYEEIDTTQSYRMENPSLTAAKNNTKAVKGQVYSFTRSNEDHYDNDEYDYDAPYWNPSNGEKELLIQLEKLKIPSAQTSDIRELEVIGSDAFGTVAKALWCLNGSEQNGDKVVAVKKIEGGVSEEERKLFLKEAVIMGQFNHPNIVKILGIVANGKEEQYEIIMEFMSKGNLRQYLQSMDKSTDVLSSQLLAFSRQIASAMSYLSMKSYVHRDLAARNILICGNNNTCKIADFGLSRDICTESFYLAHSGKIPVKWAAPESINYRLWSTASDVWSYGCVLYEIWSLGYKPFHNCNNGEVVNKLSSGFRLPPPVGCPRAIYQLMINCWNGDSESRPSFCQILSCLNEPEYKITAWSQNDKDQYSEESKTIGGNLEDGNKLYLELQNTYKKT